MTQVSTTWPLTCIHMWVFNLSYILQEGLFWGPHVSTLQGCKRSNELPNDTLPEKIHKKPPVKKSERMYLWKGSRGQRKRKDHESEFASLLVTGQEVRQTNHNLCISVLAPPPPSPPPSPVIFYICHPPTSFQASYPLPLPLLSPLQPPSIRLPRLLLRGADVCDSVKL